VRARFAVFAAALLVVAALPADGRAAPAENPCEGKEAKQLLCPNLRIGPASELFVEDNGPGRALLRATSDVRSRGRGPLELIGKRNGWRTMRTNQRIYKVGGGHITVQSDATLRFTEVGAYWGGAYWKVHQLAQFDLRRVEPDGSLGAVVRTSPKLNYCLRDLTRTQPSAVSPASRHYPGCNQNPYRSRVTLGTSVGWSDIYPAPYQQQWINVAGLSGCFSFEMIVDPEENLFESNENDNSSQRRVVLPFTGATSC
jgi:hypothetical protein